MKLEIINCNDDVVLKKVSLNNTKEVFDCIIRNREFLKKWLGWVDYYHEEEDLIKYTKTNIENFNTEKEFVYDILYKNTFVGRVSIHAIDKRNKKCEIGYWLDQEYNGKGIMTTSVEKLVDIAFNELDFHKVSILAATENYRSQAIPKRLNFELEGCLKDNEYLYGNYLDSYVFGMIKDNWKN